MEKKKKFGLPFEYQKNPEFLDALNIGDDTESKNSMIEKLLREHTVFQYMHMALAQNLNLVFGYYQIEKYNKDFQERLLYNADYY